jgi:hypothetical protein
MKNVLKLSSLFCALVLLLCNTALPASPGRATSSSEARKLFQDPPRQYSTGPLWVWNDMLTEQEIRDTMRDLAREDVKQVWVHPRPGLMTPYLSADWFRLWQTALDEAKRLDMNVWIYDENSYPSGFAGGLVPEAMPEARGMGLSLREAKSAPKWDAATVAVFQAGNGKVANVSPQVKRGDAMPEGKYLVASIVRAANSPWHGNRCYVNLLSPGVTEKFLELTMEHYRREIGSQFGNRVPGVFTDEPNIRPAGGLPWSEVLAQEFQKRWGYDLLDHLPSLSQPIGDWQKVRHNYFQVLNDQFIEHWSKPNHDYCETNRLEWTGHYWDHEWPNCVGVPDNMAMYAWHQRPAIDCLMNQYAENTHAQFGNLRMPRELSSVANQLGMKRTLCETYGAGGWDLRFEDMKRIGDWLEVLGVNTLNQHLSYVTIRGARKRDHPQSFSYHEPWWDAYHVSAEYFARLSAALSQGEQINRLLVIEPTTTAWMYQGDGAKLKKLGDSFFNLLKTLEAAQVEYDIGSEDVMRRYGKLVPAIECTPSNSKQAVATVLPRSAALQVGSRSYSAIVIPPPTENLNSATVKLLEAFLKEGPGGEVLCLGAPPARIDGTISDRVVKLAESPRWKKVEPTAILATVPPAGDGFQIHRSAEDNGILFHHRRHLADGELLFLVNTSIESPSTGIIESRQGGAEQWDLYTGKTQPYAFQRKGDSVQASFELAPSGSLLLFLPNKPMKPCAKRAEAVTILRPQSVPDIRRLEPNVLTLDYVDVTVGDETKPDVYCYQANQFAWKQNGMERDPWDSAVQFKDELIRKTFPPGSGFSASYKFIIESRVPRNLAIVVERPDLYTITCNGQTVKPKAGDWWLDKAFGRIEIAAAARKGQNVVTITAAPFTMFHELEPAYLLGDFTLNPTDKGFTIAPDHSIRLANPQAALDEPSKSDAGAAPAGWNIQGHPFYSAGVAYQESFEVKKKAGHYSVMLPKWCGSVAEVAVNGKPVGWIDSPPWQCDVTGQIKRGKNIIAVTVIGTLKNTLGPHHGNPKLGAAWPASFHTGPNPGPPPGAQYSTVAYGLFEPFVLKQSR